MAEAIPINMLGLQISGDIGDITIYTDRFGKPIWFPRSPPKVPRSAKQAAQRMRWKIAGLRWAELSDEERAAWQELAKRSSICMEGRGLFLKMAMNPDYAAFTQLFRMTGLPEFEPPEYIPREAT